MGKKNDNTLVKNASFLMVAALISKIIGMLYKSPLSTTLGSQSFALFQFAQNAGGVVVPEWKLQGDIDGTSGADAGAGGRNGV